MFCSVVFSYNVHRFGTDDQSTGVAMLASVLDPRYKTLTFLTRERRAQPRAVIRDLVDEMASAAVPEKRRKISEEKTSAMDFLLGGISVDEEEEQEKGSEGGASQSLSGHGASEFDEYSCTAGKNINGNPSDWWRDNAGRFPSIARLAKKFLCVPATSVPAERVFSTAGNIVNAKRSCLTAEHSKCSCFLPRTRSRNFIVNIMFKGLGGKFIFVVCLKIKFKIPPVY